MMVAVNQTVEGNYSRYLLVRSMDEENLKKAKEIFAYYRKQGVISGSSFEADVWKISDERTTVHVRFDFSWPVFHETTEPWIGCTALYVHEADHPIAVLTFFLFPSIPLHLLPIPLPDEKPPENHSLIFWNTRTGKNG